MIDSVTLNLVISIPDGDLNPTKWHRWVRDNGEVVYVHQHNQVKIKYFQVSQCLRITGKILRLVEQSNIKNVDDVYGMNLDGFTSDINFYINSLFYRTRVDIRMFSVTRMDYCFNVKTPYVESYVDLLSKAFRAVNNGSRKNFTAERGLHGSVYIKTRSEYMNNSKKYYALNFYNKEDWLNKKKQSGVRFSESDLAFVKDVLRLEVQVYSAQLSNIANKLGVERTFENFFSFEVALYVIGSAYKKIFGADESCDFYKYSFAKQATLTEKGKRLLELSAEHHGINNSENRYQITKIKKLGIYPYCFLPKEFELDVLENPVSLIRSKIDDIEKREDSRSILPRI